MLKLFRKSERKKKMPELIKNRFHQESIEQFAQAFQSVYPTFKVKEFLKAILDETWDDLELKNRIHRIAFTLGQFLPSDYAKAITLIDQVVTMNSIEVCRFWIFPTFVELYGQETENWTISIEALARYTSYSTSEFAVRPFIFKDEKRMMAQIYKWSKDENEHIRRLASEGCRPQLPWAQALPNYKKDPTPILPILEQLKADPSLYVRKSVANNLNDISKTHPELVIKIAKEWYGENDFTNWIVKHACRTLLKKGNHEVLEIFGYHDGTAIDVSDFSLKESSILLGNTLVFSFSIQSNVAKKVRLEYGIDYVKANGKRNRKIFKLSELLLKENQKANYTKKHAFADLSTRKHYPGIHSITLIINGIEHQTLDFELKR